MPSLSSSPWIRGAPQSGLALSHLPNQIANLAVHRRSPGSRAPTPKEPESSTVPLDNSSRLDQQYHVQTPRPQAVEQDPEQPVGCKQPEPTRPLAAKYAQLMTEGQLL